MNWKKLDWIHAELHRCDFVPFRGPPTFQKSKMSQKRWVGQKWLLAFKRSTVFSLVYELLNNQYLKLASAPTPPTLPFIHAKNMNFESFPNGLTFAFYHCLHFHWHFICLPWSTSRAVSRHSSTGPSKLSNIPHFVLGLDTAFTSTTSTASVVTTLKPLFTPWNSCTCSKTKISSRR